MSMSDELRQGRDAFRRKAWADAYDLLTRAISGDSAEPDDLERLAVAGYLSARDAGSSDAWARAHTILLSRGEIERATRCAFWLGFALLSRGESARGGGWLGRAQRLLGDRDCVERGYLLLPAALASLAKGDPSDAHAKFDRAVGAGRRFGDMDLVALGCLGRGQALIRGGQIDDGVALLDEAMAAAEAGELQPIVIGTVYCAVIETCHEIFDLRRAAEWTEALTQWCRSQPQLVLFRGQCLARRAEILQLRGSWSEALEEARGACERLSEPPGEPAAGLAFYRLGELHRLRGEYTEAERAYVNAARWGRKPQPGLALLQLGQEQVESAAASISRVVDESQGRAQRSRMLPAHVEIMLAKEDIPSARRSAEELLEIASTMDTPFVRAVGERALGAVDLAVGDASLALRHLREAAATWDELRLPYEAARTRLLIAAACKKTGDQATARLELNAAESTFRELGARPDLDRAEALSSSTSGPRSQGEHGLTEREREVLQCLATGETNKSIAAVLCISERTVERHVSNLFRKLRVSTRTAAAAYAYEHDLV
jgi:DNA-binding CsgD family transcriptional regulator